MEISDDLVNLAVEQTRCLREYTYRLFLDRKIQAVLRKMTLTVVEFGIRYMQLAAEVKKQEILLDLEGKISKIKRPLTEQEKATEVLYAHKRGADAMARGETGGVFPHLDRKRIKRDN
jgi:hypothetical protein